jgi:hypothetical protein
VSPTMRIDRLPLLLLPVPQSRSSKRPMQTLGSTSRSSSCDGLLRASRLHPRFYPAGRAVDPGRIVSNRRGRGVCEGVQKRSFLKLKATMASGKKDRFTGGDGNVKLIGVP